MFRSVAVCAVALICSLLFTSTSAQTAAQVSLANDLTVLNYALTLENLEATFYAQGLAKFNQSQFAAGSFNYSTYAMLTMIAAHEAQHVATLTTVINQAAPGQAAPACTYNFTAALATPASFIAYALALETGGQQAYDGALNGITTQAYAQAAASIATVEGRHAAYLALIQAVPQVPFPTAFDNATLPAAIAAIIAPFIISCPYNITLPTVRPSGVALNAAGQVVITGNLSGTTYTTAQQQNDIVVLNYALTLENLEAAFYNYAAANFTSAQFVAAGFPAYYYTYSTQYIQVHENTHVSALTAVITGRGGVAAPPCVYNFSSVNSVAAYFTTAQLLENTGVSAYDGAAALITDTNLQTVAATIATVEARHAAFLNLANNASAFPATFDTPLTPAQIVSAVLATGLIVSCPYTIVAPTYITPAILATSVRGDPSFVGFHGQSFQVHGIPNRYFNLLSTASLQFNALFRMLVDGESLTATQMKAARVSRQLAATKSTKASKLYSLPLTTAYSHEGTFLAEMGLKLNDVQVFAQAGAYATGFSKVTVAGVAVSVSSTATEIATGMYVTLSTPSVLTIDTPQVSFTLVNADNFFNIEQATLNQAHTDDSVMDGLLGQTANPAWKVLNDKEFKQHMVYDYLLAEMDAFSDDFVSNVYTAAKAQ